MKSYQQPPSRKSKKAGRKREGSPYDPYKRKARGKENNPGVLCTGLFACERPRDIPRAKRAATAVATGVRVGIRKRLIEAAVEDALVTFCGTRKRKPGKPRDGRDARCPSFSDEQLWAKFAWKFGWGLLRELTLQGEAEMRERRKPIKDEDKPKVLQRLINPFWRNNKRTTASGTARDGGEDSKRTTTSGAARKEAK